MKHRPLVGLATVAGTALLALSVGTAVHAKPHKPNKPKQSAAAISGKNYFDENGNGIRDTDDIYHLSSMTIELRDDTGVLQTTTASGPSEGEYRFSDLVVGHTYWVCFLKETVSQLDLPEGVNKDELEASPKGQGSNEAFDSDINPDGCSDPAAVQDGDNNVDALFTAPQPATILGTAWYDSDEDGLQDDDEDPLQDVLVTAYDRDGNVLGSTRNTNGFGNYNFDLDPGVEVELVFTAERASTSSTPARPYDPTKPNVGNDDSIDSDIGTDGRVVVTSPQRGQFLRINAGFVVAPMTADLAVDVTATGGLRRPVEYALTVRNDSRWTVPAVITMDMRGNGWYIDSGLLGGEFACKASGNQRVCQTGPLSPATSATFIVEVKYHSLTLGEVGLDAAVEDADAQFPDPNDDNNSASATCSALTGEAIGC